MVDRHGRQVHMVGRSTDSRVGLFRESAELGICLSNERISRVCKGVYERGRPLFIAITVNIVLIHKINRNLSLSCPEDVGENAEPR